jgi:hypothetical protein
MTTTQVTIGQDEQAAERALFAAAYLAEFGDPARSGVYNGVELAWLTGPGRMWLAARRALI